MVKIYLMRHGETADNVAKKHQSSSSSLNEKGLSQARSAAERLKELNISAIYSSPFLRTMQTARIIQEQHKHLNIKEVNDLRERYFGDFIGLTKTDILKIMPNVETEWEKQGMDWKAPGGGESMKELQSRTVKAFKHIADNHNEENIVIISAMAV